MVKTIEWTTDGVIMIDQRKLPLVEEYVLLKNHHEVADAIKSMIIRGAPAIGVSAAMGIALGIKWAPETLSQNELDDLFKKICHEMASTRPTAVNLFWAIRRMEKKYNQINDRPISEIQMLLEKEAVEIHQEDIASNRRMGQFGRELFSEETTFLTHCNAGGLATGGYGTALGVIQATHENGKCIRVFADETRPFLQGARLTAWELQKLNIPVTVITDNMAGHILSRGLVDAVVVGADRIAANGDTANKIGTYMVAVLASVHQVPFYVAAPLSTVDFAMPSGDGIPIEERDVQEVTHVGNFQLTPEGVNVFNPAFDVTPNHYVTAIITDRGIARPPFQESLDNLR